MEQERENYWLQQVLKKMDVPLKECTAQNGHVVHLPSGRQLSFGELALIASKLEPSSNPRLKSEENFRFVGKPMRRVDIPKKVNGSAIYSSDIRPSWNALCGG